MSTERMRFSKVELPGKPNRMMTFSIGVMNSTLQRVKASGFKVTG